MIDAENLEKYAIGTAIFCGLGFGAYLLVNKQVQKAKITQIDQTSLDDGSAGNLARKLKMAFQNDNYFGWGTNVPAVYDAFKQLKSKSQFSQVKAAYQTLFKSSLDADLQDELSSSEWNKVQAIYASKPK